MRLSSWDIEERVINVVARLAGVSASHVRPDLSLGWDMVKLFHRAQPRRTIRAGDLVIELQ